MTMLHGKISFLLLGLSLVVAAAGCSKTAEAPRNAQTQPVSVTLARAESRELDTTIDVVGSLKGWEEVEVGAKRAGRVARTRYDVGARVAPGEVLVELDPVDTELTLRQSERRLEAEMTRLGIEGSLTADFDLMNCPQIRQAQVAFERAKERLRREQTLKERNVTTDEAFQNAEFDVREGQAALDNAILTTKTTLATIEAARVDVEAARQARLDMDIRAPQPSVIPEGLSGPLTYAMTKRLAVEGQMVQPGEVVAHLVIEDPLRAWANVPERYAPYVKEGQAVKLRVASYADRDFDGAIRWVNPAVDASSRTFTVEISVRNPQRELRSGNFAKIAIVVEHKPRTVVPSEAIVRFAGVTKLFVVRDQKAVEVPIVLGRLYDNWIEVIGEVTPGDTVVTSGQSRLADGIAIVERTAEQPADAVAPPAAEPATTAPSQTAEADAAPHAASPGA